jgi:hypothetical protein
MRSRLFVRKSPRVLIEGGVPAEFLRMNEVEEIVCPSGRRMVI